MDQFRFNSQGKMNIKIGEKAPVIIEDKKDPTLEDVNRAIDAAFVPVGAVIEAFKSKTTITSKEIAKRAKDLMEEISKIPKMAGEGKAHFVYDNYFQLKFREYIHTLNFGDTDKERVGKILLAIDDALSSEKAGKVILQFFRKKAASEK